MLLGQSLGCRSVPLYTTTFHNIVCAPRNSPILFSYPLMLTFPFSASGLSLQSHYGFCLGLCKGPQRSMGSLLEIQPRLFFLQSYHQLLQIIGFQIIGLVSVFVYIFKYMYLYQVPIRRTTILDGNPIYPLTIIIAYVENIL